MFLGGGLISESVDLGLDKMNGAFVLVVQSLVRDRDEESMASMLFVPRVIPQFSGMKRFVQKESFQIQNKTKLVLKHFHFFQQQALYQSLEWGSSFLFSCQYFNLGMNSSLW